MRRVCEGHLPGAGPGPPVVFSLIPPDGVFIRNREILPAAPVAGGIDCVHDKELYVIAFLVSKGVDIVSYRDLSCEGKRKSKYKNNIYDVTIDYDTNPEVDENYIKN